MATQDDPELDRWVDAPMATLQPDPESEPHVGDGLAQLKAGQSHAAGRRPIAIWLVTAAVAVWAGALVVTVGPGSDPGSYDDAPPGDDTLLARLAPPASTDASGDGTLASARRPRELVLTPIDERPDAPHFTLPDADGANVMLTDYAGRVLLLNFWATWCGPCKVEMPWFVDFEERFSDDGFAVVGVSLDEPGWDIVRPFLERQPLNYRIALADTPERLAPFGDTYVLPKTWLIDREGRLAAEHIGLVPADSIESQIQALLAE
ncbi:MAG: TlpA disulfide reductase family protein [Acidobacteria bacterium]|nr:TlpA disulfide reductase family protein [Acidobacteriota bacterium]